MKLNEFRAAYPQYNDLDDATVVANLRKSYPDIPQDEFYQRLGYDPLSAALKELASEYSAPQAVLIGAGKATSDLWEGAKQLVGMGRSEADRAEAERLYAPLNAARPTATAIGESAPYMAAGGIAGVGRGLLGTIGRQAAAGASVGAGMEGDVADRAAKAGTEAAIGGIGGAVGHSLGRMFGLGMQQAGPGVASSIATAKGLGYEILPTTGLPGRNLKQIVQGGLESLPGSAYLLDELASRNQTRLASAAMDAIGETGKELTEGTLSAARSRIGKTIGDVSDLTPKVDVTGVVQDLQRIATERVSPMIAGPEDPIGAVVNRATEYLTTAAQRGGATGKEMFRQQSAIGNAARGAMSSNPELGLALFDLQQSLLKAMEKSAPGGFKGQMKRARSQYRTLSQLETGQNIDPVTGRVFPGRMANSLAKTDRRGFTEGGNRTPFYEGVRFMGRQQPELPTSGTAERTMGRELLRSIGAGAGVGGAGGVAGGDPLGGAGAGGLAGLGIGFLAPNLAARAYLSPMMYEWMRRQASPAVREAANLGGLGAVRANQ